MNDLISSSPKIRNYIFSEMRMKLYNVPIKLIN